MHIFFLTREFYSGLPRHPIKWSFKKKHTWSHKRCWLLSYFHVKWYICTGESLFPSRIFNSRTTWFFSFVIFEPPKLCNKRLLIKCTLIKLDECMRDRLMDITHTIKIYSVEWNDCFSRTSRIWVSLYPVQRSNEMFSNTWHAKHTFRQFKCIQERGLAPEDTFLILNDPHKWHQQIEVDKKVFKFYSNAAFPIATSAEQVYTVLIELFNH